MIDYLLVSAPALMLACTLWLTWYLRKKTQFIINSLNSHTRDIASGMWTIRTINEYVGGELILPSAGLWTLDAPAIATLCDVLRSERPTHVVELGSGLSTVIIASMLKGTGGKLTSIDHDEHFAGVTKQFLEANGFSDMVDLRIAPLVPLEGKSDELWYDTKSLDDLKGIDFLVVDGPPMPVNPTIRRHALPYFYERFSPKSTILLDDAERKGEKSVIEEWLGSFPVKSIRKVGFPKTHALMTLVR